MIPLSVGPVGQNVLHIYASNKVSKSHLLVFSKCSINDLEVTNRLSHIRPKKWRPSLRVKSTVRIYRKQSFIVELFFFQ